MLPHELENKVLGIIDRVKAKQPTEDARVELKAEWIDAKKAARQLAGHANAARGQPILWVIGLDENKGVVGATKEELANWYPQIERECDGLAPHLALDIVVPTDGKSVVALLFETDRAPYVVLNPDRGSGAAAKIHREVPWRSATGVRSAKRSDLIRLLSPLQKIPNIEVVDCSLYISELGPDTGGNSIPSGFEMDLYIVPKTPDLLVLPNHKCRGAFMIFESEYWKEFDGLFAEESMSGPRPGKCSPPANLVVSRQEATITGPCMIRIRGFFNENPDREDFSADGSVRVELGFSAADEPRIVEVQLHYEGEPTSPYKTWKFEGEATVKGGHSPAS